MGNQGGNIEECEKILALPCKRFGFDFGDTKLVFFFPYSNVQIFVGTNSLIKVSNKY